MDHWEKDVSSAKSLVVDDNPQLRSLIYIKKNKGHRVGLWGTPAETSTYVDCATSWTTEKRDASSAKSLVVDDNPQLRSLIYIKKNKGHRIGLWGTPAETSTQDEDWLFKTTLWYLLLKMFSMSFNWVSDILNDLILYINPSCQTLSKV